MKIVGKPKETYHIRHKRLNHFSYVINGVIHLSGKHKQNYFQIHESNLYFCHVCCNDLKGYGERMHNSNYESGKFEMIINKKNNNPIFIRKKLMSLSKCWWLKDANMFHNYDDENNEETIVNIQKIIKKTFKITFYEDNNVNGMLLHNKNESFKSECFMGDTIPADELRY